MAGLIRFRRRGLVVPALACGVALGLTAGQAPTATAAEPLSTDQAAFFEARVRPLLVTKCQSCHGERIAEAGLRLDSRRSMLAGSDSGPVVVPGDAAASKLLAAVRHTGDVAMPPDGKLSPDEIATLETWVAGGVPWSGPGSEADGTTTASPAGTMQTRLEEALAGHWAFTPPVRQAAPELPESFPASLRETWSTAPIDRFLGARIAAAGLAPAAEAAPRELYRRLSYDLTGLPPTADAADAFCAEAAAGPEAADRAFRTAVDRMLASRTHAEHWARKWLDLARYADTMGYAIDNQDACYPFAWTYRDWVIDALHRDLPYDRFITLQLAADRIDPPGPPADLAALGFLTVGRTFLGNTHDIIDDRIDLVTRGLLGLTVACGRCHDHKYEPVSMADYYALHGIFASSRVPEELPVIGAAPAGPEAEAFQQKLAELQAAVAAQEAEIHARGVREAVAHAADYFSEVARPADRGADKRPPRLADGYELEQLLLDRLGRLLDKAETTHPILGPWAAARGKADAEIAAALATVDAAKLNPLVAEELASARPTTLRGLAEVYGRLIARVAPEQAGGAAPATDEPAAVSALRKLFGAEGSPLVVPRAEALRIANRAEETERRKRKKAITKHLAEAAGGPPRAMVLVDAEKPVDSHVLLRGNPGRPGEKVERRLPALLGGGGVDRGSSGRLDLARAIVAADNPLAARVLVNWAWTHHFGRGLVDTPGDFGLRGEPPVHPELLDDLARRFLDEGRQSLRWLHREIVTSRAWRQSAAPRPELADRDPDDRLFARGLRRRLDWEAWRDSLLAAAGTLDGEHPGGPGVDPLVEGSLHARSVYGRLDRQDVPGLLRVFDVANPDTAVHVRPRTTVPQQSLAVLNAPLVVAAARRTAARAEREAGAAASDTDKISALWRVALARSPTAAETRLAADWLGAEAALDAAAEQPAGLSPWERLAHAVLASAEFQFVD